MIEEKIDTKIEKALQNKDITNIMHKASKRFIHQLDKDTIYTCQINALWKAFVNFKPEKNTKFTTYLFNGVFIECLKEIKFKNKSNRCKHKLHDNIAEHNDRYLMVDILDEITNEEDRQLLLDKISNMTIQEMANKRNISRETVRKKLKKLTKNFQQKFL
jgi:DNA-directed RNA polymerase specialized sigma subunit